MALTIAQIAEQLLPKLSGIKKEADIDAIDLVAELGKPENAALKTDYDAISDSDKADQLNAATKSRFAVVTTDHIDKKIKAPINSKPQEYDLVKGEAEITLNGLTGVKVKSGSGVTVVSESGDKLKLKIDPSYTDGSNIVLEGTYNGKTVTLDTVQFKPKALAVKDVTLKDKKVTFDLESGVTMTNAQATAATTDTFKVTVDKDGGNKVTIEQLKDVDKAGKDLVLRVTAGGKEVNKTVKVKPEGADAAAEESGGIAGWAMSNWKLLTGVVAGLVGLFASSKEEGGGYLGTALGAVGGLLVGWNYAGYLSGNSAEEAKPAKP